MVNTRTPGRAFKGKTVTIAPGTTTVVGKVANGEGSFYFNEGRARWEGVVTVGYRPDGKPVRRSVSDKNKNLAFKKFETLQEETAQETKSEDHTVLGYLEWWLETQEAKVINGKKDHKTYEQCVWALNIVINTVVDKRTREAVGDKKLRDLTVKDVEAVLHQMASQGDKFDSVNRVRSTLGMALDTALGRDLVTKNVARLAEMPATEPSTPKRSLTVEQARALLELAKDGPLEALLVVGMTAGPRIGELRGLRWECVDLDNRMLTINKSLKRGRNGVQELGDVKRGIQASRRVFELPTSAVMALKRHQVRQKRDQLKAGERWKNPHGYVFTTGYGAPWQARNLARSLDKLTEAAGLGHWTPTELGRHTAGSLMSAEGVPNEVIASLYGHNSTRMAEANYLHPVKPTVGGHVEVMEKLFGPDQD